MTVLSVSFFLMGASFWSECWLEGTRGGAVTTREKPSSSAGLGPLSSAGTGATNKALQLTYSSSACCPTLLLYMNRCSAL